MMQVATIVADQSPLATSTPYQRSVIHGEMMANGEDGRMLNEVFQGMYRGSHAQDIAAESGSASNTRGF